VIERADGMLIDGVFQPIADRLTWLASPYQIAKFFVTGFLVGQCIDTACGDWLPWLAPLRLLACLFVVRLALRDADRAQRHADSGRRTANPLRGSRTLALGRLINVWMFGVGPSLIAVSANYTHASGSNVIYAGSCWLYVAAGFFVACSLNPPLRRQSRPAFLTP
jgi:hypothetical protein